MSEKVAEGIRLTGEHYRELGYDLDKPMDKTLIRHTRVPSSHIESK